VGRQLRAFPIGDAGLQPELLAVAVQPGEKLAVDDLKHTTLVDGAIAFSVYGGQDLRHAGRVASAIAINIRSSTTPRSGDGGFGVMKRWIMHEA